MIRLFFASAGMGLAFKLLYQADDFVTQTICLLLIPLFVIGAHSAIKDITAENKDDK